MLNTLETEYIVGKDADIPDHTTQLGALKAEMSHDPCKSNKIGAQEQSQGTNRRQ